MDTGDEIPWQLLTRYLSGVTSAAERTQIERWVATDPSRERLVRVLLEGWRASGSIPERHDPSAGWARIEVRIGRRADRRAVVAIERVSVPEGAWWTRPWFWVAAVALISVGAGTFLLRPFGPPAERRAADARPLQSDQTFRKTTTRRGERATVMLPDSSRVTLGAASTLRYPLAFSRASRTGETRYQRDLYLEGEAFFEVTADSLHPFVVHTRGAETRVLGTKFVVRANPNDSVVNVAVSEGKVALKAVSSSRPNGGKGAESANRVALLTRGEVGRVVRGDEAAVIVGADADRYLAWTDGELVFRDTPLREVVAELARWYDVDVRLAAGTESILGSRRFTATFKNQRVDEVLTFLALSADVRLRRSGQSVVVSFK